MLLMTVLSFKATVNCGYGFFIRRDALQFEKLNEKIWK